MSPDLGLALSGGGSRAAAFHRGTVRALDELGIIPRVKTLSSVSGGSVFAAAWLAARARERTDQQFLTWMREVLERGFIKHALLHPRILKVLSPWRTRTHRIAETFDEVLFDKLTWKDLPASPLLCLNTTLLNNAHTGRFSQTGYSSEGVGERQADGSYAECEAEVSIGFATACSAAFPFGLPPLSIASDRFPHVDPRLGKRLLFTDGGILENLGVERLLKSKRFGTRHILVSDAAVQDLPWQPRLLGKLRGALIYALSAQILERLLSIMNNKQNATMRALLFAELTSELAERRFVFVRLAQTWAGLIKPGQEERPELAVARKLHTEMGGDRAANQASEVATSFVGLSPSTLDLLEAHARWQTHAMIQLYGKDLLPGVARSEASGT